jgi:hypothetical protein
MEMMHSEKQIYDAHFSSMFNQFTNARRITGISPLSLMNQSMEAITAGGYLRFIKNWEALRINQQQLLEYFKDVDARDNDSPHWLNPFEELSSSKKPVKFEEIPIYTEQWPGLAERFSDTARYGGILLIYTMLIFVVSLWIFNRYDVR